MKKLVRRLCVVCDEAYRHQWRDINPKLFVDLKTSGRRSFLPFRPIVMAGDDITFVCDGRLGVPLTAFLLRELYGDPQDDPQGFSACGGVAIVKAHAPFSAAYEAAEKLCSNAKQFGQGEKPAVDWQIFASGLNRDLPSLRKRDWKLPGDGELSLRPMYVNDEEYRHIGTIEDILKGFESWSSTRIRSVYQTLKKGPAAVASLLSGWESEASLPLISDYEMAGGSGYSSNQCLYFDAIELRDFYLPLQQEEEKQ
jgi:hypothetical protein